MWRFTTMLINIKPWWGSQVHVTSNPRSEFISLFFHSLGNVLNISPPETPEDNRQTERVNQNIEHYLQIHCNYHQDNHWDLLPPMDFHLQQCFKCHYWSILIFCEQGLSSKTLQPIQNITSIQSALETLLWTLMNYMDSFRKTFLRPNNNTSNMQTPNNFQHQSSLSEVKSLSKRNTSEPPGPLRNYLKLIWALLKLLLDPRTHSYTLQLPDTKRSCPPSILCLGYTHPNLDMLWIQSQIFILSIWTRPDPISFKPFPFLLILMLFFHCSTLQDPSSTLALYLTFKWL